MATEKKIIIILKNTQIFYWGMLSQDRAPAIKLSQIDYLLNFFLLLNRKHF